jgi:hypothetical protein
MSQGAPRWRRWTRAGRFRFPAVPSHLAPSRIQDYRSTPAPVRPGQLRRLAPAAGSRRAPGSRPRVAAVPTQGLHERQLALLGPAGHRLGRDVQDVGHLGGQQVAGCLAALALCSHRVSSPTRTRSARPRPDRTGWLAVRTCGGDGASLTLLALGDAAIIPTISSGHHSQLGLFQCSSYVVPRAATSAPVENRGEGFPRPRHAWFLGDAAASADGVLG